MEKIFAFVHLNLSPNEDGVTALRGSIRSDAPICVYIHAKTKLNQGGSMTTKGHAVALYHLLGKSQELISDIDVVDGCGPRYRSYPCSQHLHLLVFQRVIVHGLSALVKRDGLDLVDILFERQRDQVIVQALFNGGASKKGLKVPRAKTELL